MKVIAGFLALAMCVAWIGFVAQSVIILTEHEIVLVLGWIIALPVFLAVEYFAWTLLDRLAVPGH